LDLPAKTLAGFCVWAEFELMGGEVLSYWIIGLLDFLLGRLAHYILYKFKLDHAFFTNASSSTPSH
jgi:uncharacterized membrane protein YecN with MAPEG domain